MMHLDYENDIESLSPEKRLHFYELLAHNLTITIRGIWSEPDLSDGEKLDQIYLVNEILHMVTAKVYTLRLNLHEWTERDSWLMIESYMTRSKAIEQGILAEINYSYNCAVGMKKEEDGRQNDA